MPKMPNTPMNNRQPVDTSTLGSMKRVINRMQGAGLVFLIVGLTMPKYAPFMAEQSWKLLIGVRVGLPQAVAVFGCIMLIVSIFCFLRSYRCPHCGGLVALTSYSRLQKCRSCEKRVTEADHFWQNRK